jgi:restriction system protein
LTKKKRNFVIMKNRKRRAKAHTPRVHWQTSDVLTLLGASFFWFAADFIHLPLSRSNALVHTLDVALHSWQLLLIAGLVVFIYGGLVTYAAFARDRIRARLLDHQKNLDDILAMTWQEFELMTGEYFKRSGYRIAETGLGGADGGIDLILHRGREKTIVQCKQWRTSSVGASTVREMFGLMAHHKAQKVIVVCCGKFTRDATSFALNKPIELINGERLVRLVRSVQ